MRDPERPHSARAGNTVRAGHAAHRLSSDYVRSCFCDADPASWLRVLDMLDGLGREGNAWLDREAVPGERRHQRRILDARYRGQNFEVKVDCSGLGAGDFEKLVRRFHAAHDREYGYFIADSADRIRHLPACSRSARCQNRL